MSQRTVGEVARMEKLRGRFTEPPGLSWADIRLPWHGHCYDTLYHGNHCFAIQISEKNLR